MIALIKELLYEPEMMASNCLCTLCYGPLDLGRDHSPLDSETLTSAVVLEVTAVTAPCPTLIQIMQPGSTTHRVLLSNSCPSSGLQTLLPHMGL